MVDGSNVGEAAIARSVEDRFADVSGKSLTIRFFVMGFFNELHP